MLIATALLPLQVHTLGENLQQLSRADEAAAAAQALLHSQLAARQQALDAQAEQLEQLSAAQEAKVEECTRCNSSKQTPGFRADLRPLAILFDIGMSSWHVLPDLLQPVRHAAHLYSKRHTLPAGSWRLRFSCRHQLLTRTQHYRHCSGKLPLGRSEQNPHRTKYKRLPGVSADLMASVCYALLMWSSGIACYGTACLECQ